MVLSTGSSGDNNCCKSKGLILSKYVAALSEKFIAVATIIVFGLLGIASIFITVRMADYTEEASYAGLTFPLVTLVCAIIIIIYTLLCKVIALKNTNVTTIGLAVALILFAGSIIWSILCNTSPTFDQLDLIHAAKELGAGRTGMWAPGWYMERFPYQTPYVVLIRFMWRLFGDDMLYPSLELINSLCSATTGYLIVKLSSELFSPRAALGTALITVLLLPIYFYSTFAYGNIPALPFAVGALLSLHCGLKRNKFRYYILSSISITISIMIKSTMQVVLIAMLLTTILHAAQSGKIRFVAIVPSMIVIYLLITGMFNSAISNHYGVVLNNGVPKTAYIAMGLSDSSEYPNVSNNPGYYNGFIWNWQDDYDTDIAAKDSWTSVCNSMETFFKDPIYALHFFAKKIAVVWLEPTYTSLTNGNWSTIVTLETTHTSLNNDVWSVISDVGQAPLSERPMTSLLSSIYYGKLNKIILVICDSIQSILLLSPVAVLLSKRDKVSSTQVLPALAALGFFIVYLFWESKSQYSLQAYILLLVYTGPTLDTILTLVSLHAPSLQKYRRQLMR